MKRYMLSVTVFLLALCMPLMATAPREKVEAGAEETITLTWFMGAPSATQLKDRNEMAAFQEIEKQTGVHIEWQQPAVGAFDEQFTLILASGELPDLLSGDWATIPGGPQRYIDDKIIIPLNDYAAYMTNYQKYLNLNQEIKKTVSTTAGKIYVFPFITEPAIKNGYYGLMIRKEWLDRLDLDIPKTVIEWYDILKAFRDRDANGNGDPNDELPFLSRFSRTGLDFFCGSFGVMGNFFEAADHSVKFGPIEEGYRQWLATMAKWYQEGLIDPDFPTNGSKRSDALFLDDKAGAVGEFVTRTQGRLMDLGREKYESYTWVATPWPIGPAGKKLLSWRGDGRLFWTGGVTVTTACKTPDRAVKYLDFFFSEKGNRLLNFGVEGVTYNIVNGEPKFTNLITNNPDGYSLAEARTIFIPATDDPLGVEVKEAFFQFLTYPEQIEGMEIWADNDGVLGLPQVALADEDAQKVSKIMGDINTYVSENVSKFIMGEKPLSEFNDYVSTIRKMGIDDAIAVYQAAVKEFNAR